MKREIYTIRSMTPDGVVHDIGTVIYEGNQKVYVDNRMLESEAQRAQREKKLSARCRFEEGYG